MTRSEWLTKNFTHVTFDECVGNLRVPKINVDLTYGLISTESKEEFSKLVFHLMPSGTVVDEIPDEFYEGKICCYVTCLPRCSWKNRTTRWRTVT